MPKILERLVSQLEAKGKPKSNAFAIATSQLQKHGVLKKGTQELTGKGAERQAMGAEGRAKDRAAQGSRHAPGDYTYSKKTNRATLGYAEGGTVDAGRKYAGQLSAGYWERVAREAAMRRAAQPDPTAGDARDRAINEYLAPPGPRSDTTLAYQNGGVMGRQPGSFAQGGPPLGRTGIPGTKKY
jgi:hypothetical protein